ncbi:hypothetical protein GMORB2_1373 [Geosmithia morbida]|uniref:Microbial-type PARG catalytic domain-containing protein n=1 Tax=Geosmithia morbida TaxID=1094350 RepID=A0A9P4Z2B4_9HYPO|nr:uncharacterized protein GMORB2_1373 [Geosmithia morbida]KAF4126127.1 hypothetical protein GMORB2_1373 [Geosmithia morbida]
MYPRPTRDLQIPRQTLSTRPPVFVLEGGDPVDRAIHYSVTETQSSQARGEARVRVPFISAANERRPGGDWETGSSGYEEKLCRRSNLWATLNTPWPGTGPSSGGGGGGGGGGSGSGSNYPIPPQGGILSNSVVVYRGPHDGYERLDGWYDLPVVSVPPTRWPKLRDNGTRYSFAQERDMMREKMRAALGICLYNNYPRVVIGDFGLGNSYRNPPREVAEMWRDLFLFDPDIRGQFHYVVFVFDDAHRSTSHLIRDEMYKKESKRGGGRASVASAGAAAAARIPHHHHPTEDCHGITREHGGLPTDLAIFEEIFDPREVQRVLSQPDPRYGLAMITS